MKILEVQVGDFFPAQVDILIYLDRKSLQIVHRWCRQCSFEFSKKANEWSYSRAFYLEMVANTQAVDFLLLYVANQ